LTQAGSWFANFHLAGFSWFGTSDLAEKLRTILSRVSADLGMSSTLGDALEFLNHGAQRLGDQSYRLMTLHGDAKPENLIVGPQRISGVDIEGRFINVAEMDVAQFLVQANLAAANPLGLLDEDSASEIEQSFLDGYAQVTVIDLDLLRWMEVYFSISFWASERRHHALRSRIHAQVYKQAIAMSIARSEDPARATRGVGDRSHGIRRDGSKLPFRVRH
jgi:aminoglycoside phosphotransferase (APT) family kinase protein